MRLNFKTMFLASVSCLSLLFAVGCTQDDEARQLDDAQLEERSIFTNLSQVTQLIGLTPDNQLVFLKSGPPVKETGSVAITGARDGELIVAIDMEPGTSGIGGSGILYGVSNMSVLYRLDPVTGVATAITQDTAFTPALEGELVSFDFDPVEGVIRIVTNKEQNLRVSPETGLVVSVDTGLKPGLYEVNGAAYAAKPGGTTSVLYFLDVLNKSLAKVGAPNDGGELEFLGFTGFDLSGEGGFEIVGSNLGMAVGFGKGRVNAASPSNGFDNTLEEAYRLLNINLSNGKATSYGRTRPLIGVTVR